ncbi:MAG TPA: hypothetical protein PLJ35_21895 [Anaerolineae bacterium]|nr:hypothetical protein [Anaerolineae bacterium]HOR01474.1 hypothetical protein [Anaerolineae bacterium]HPL30387.1 hypothetical protein [Anaerolineae bacterium]
MKHIKLLNKPDKEIRLPTLACTTDTCHISNGPPSCPAVDLCWWDYDGSCSEHDECTVDRG